MSTKDNPCTLPINLYDQVQPTITALDFSKIAGDRQDGARTTAHYDNSHALLYSSRDVTPPRGGGYSIYPCVGRCGAAPHTLTLFKTNIADFPSLFKTEFRFLIPCFRHLTRILINNFTFYHPRKDILFKTRIDKSIP